MGPLEGFEKEMGCSSIRIVMLATEFHGVAHAWHQHDLVLTWQSSQSIGGVMMHQGLASDLWLLIFGHLFLWPTIHEEELHPIWSDKAHTCSSTSASIAKMNACRRNRMQLHPDSDVGHGIPWCGPCLAST